MHTITAADVMTREPVTAEPSTPFKDLVDLMVGEQVSALPVVNRRGVLLGVVSEADLLRRAEHADEASPGRPSRFAGHHARVDWRKATGLTAAGLMTTPALAVAGNWTLPQVAREFTRTGVRRLFVVDGGRLVGVLARRDVLRPYLRGDREIEHEIDTEIFGRAVHAKPGSVRATVECGVVLLTGRLEYQADTTTAANLARRVPGVVEVRNRLDWQWNGDGPAIHTFAASNS